MADLSMIRDIVAIVGVVAGFTYYVMTLRNQTRTRQAQLFMSIYRSTSDPEAQERYLDIQTIEMNGIEDWNRLKEDREKFKVLGWYLSYYEGIGVLISEGLLDIGLVARLSSGNIIWFWEKYRDGLYDLREKFKWVRFAIEVEYLYNKIVEYAEKHPELNIEAPEQM